MNERELTVDVLVVGSGNGGLTAALCAYEFGLKDVLVVEKSELYGGTSASSGGGVWIPCNRYAREAGAQDSFEEAREYLRGTISDSAVSDAMIETYLREGPKMIDFLHDRPRIPVVRHVPSPGKRFIAHAEAAFGGARRVYNLASAAQSRPHDLKRAELALPHGRMA